MTELIENTALAEYDCMWCSARKGRDVHSRACPIGERYKQIQKLGGVGWPKGKPLLDPSELNCQRGRVEGQAAPEKPASRGSESGANSAETGPTPGTEAPQPVTPTAATESLEQFVSAYYAERAWRWERGL